LKQIRQPAANYGSHFRRARTGILGMIIKINTMTPYKDIRRSYIAENLLAMYTINALLLTTEREVPHIDKTEAKFVLKNFIANPPNKLVEMINQNIGHATQAAAMVFMHSAYENSIFDLISFLIKYDPEPWYEYIDRRKIDFASIRTKSPTQLGEILLANLLEELEKASLPNKVERLLAVLKPKTVKDVIPGFEFSLDELKRIDTLRHQLTHHPDFSKPLGNIRDMLAFLHRTVLFVEKIAELKYT